MALLDFLLSQFVKPALATSVAKRLTQLALGKRHDGKAIERVRGGEPGLASGECARD